ncbi:MAG: threonine/serine dehydratase [Rhodovibrionaceae bacterium]|nr:threonine/serine dehydratase [Rhodovibrionaceae bacterium]
MAIELPLDEIRATRERLGERVIETPVYEWRAEGVLKHFPQSTRLFAKLELLQHAGSFKARGALNNLMSMSDDERQAGVTAFSAGNHAIAVSFAARKAGSSAKVVMPKSANPARQERVRAEGGELVLVDTIAEAEEAVQRIQQDEGRRFIHPYEGRRTFLGTATVALEFMTQVPDLDAVIVPVGGGGLIAGMATAIKQINPNCAVYGVEPFGADTTWRSLQSGKPEAIDEVRTIADSLGAPKAMPEGFALIQRHVDDVVRVEDDDLRAAMARIFRDFKLAVEPAGAAATAGLFGPLKDRLGGQRVGLTFCGTNIDADTYSRHLHDAPEID